MTTILFMVSVALVLSGTFVFCYIWAFSNGQFDDLKTPAMRILKEDFKSTRISERDQHENK